MLTVDGMTVDPFTVKTLAERWKCCEATIRRKVADGELRCFRVGSKIRIPASKDGVPAARRDGKAEECAFALEAGALPGPRLQSTKPPPGALGLSATRDGM